MTNSSYSSNRRHKAEANPTSKLRNAVISQARKVPNRSTANAKVIDLAIRHQLKELTMRIPTRN